MSYFDVFYHTLASLACEQSPKACLRRSTSVSRTARGYGLWAGPKWMPVGGCDVGACYATGTCMVNIPGHLVYRVHANIRSRE